MTPLKARVIYLLERAHEKYFFKKADMLFYCNQNEKKYYEKIMGQDRAVFLPNVSVYEGVFERPASLPDKYVLWVGSMLVNFHMESILFLLKNVWLKVSEKFNDLHFVIAGRTDKASILLLNNSCKELKRVVIVKNPETIEGYIQNAIAVLSYHCFGSGTRIKILDAMALGVPVIANNEEIEQFCHISNKDLLIANTAEEFIQKLDMLLRDSELRDSISKNAKEIVHKHYTNKALIPMVKKHINFCMQMPPYTL